MQLPPGLAVANPHLVCRLQRSLYSLKQASRQWFMRLSSFLISHSFQEASADHSLFLSFIGNSTTVLLVYVDDIVLIGNNIDAIRHITALLDHTFKIKDLGFLKYFLGLEVAQTQHGIHLCQQKYTLDILFDSGMVASRPNTTPMDYVTRLHATLGELLSTEASSSYRRLIYLTDTCPHIAHAV